MAGTLKRFTLVTMMIAILFAGASTGAMANGPDPESSDPVFEREICLFSAGETLVCVSVYVDGEADGCRGEMEITLAPLTQIGGLVGEEVRLTQASTRCDHDPEAGPGESMLSAGFAHRADWEEGGEHQWLSSGSNIWIGKNEAGAECATIVFWVKPHISDTSINLC